MIVIVNAIVIVIAKLYYTIYIDADLKNNYIKYRIQIISVY